MDQDLTFESANHNNLKNMIVMKRDGSLKYKIPNKFNKDQEEVLYHAITVFNFLVFPKHNVSYKELAELIKKSYDLRTPQNSACYNILILANGLTES